MIPFPLPISFVCLIFRMSYITAISHNIPASYTPVNFAVLGEMGNSQISISLLSTRFLSPASHFPSNFHDLGLSFDMLILVVVVNTTWTFILVNLRIGQCTLLIIFIFVSNPLTLHVLHI